MKRLTTFLMALLLTWIGANAQITSGTNYLIKNVETGYYLGGGLVWGTAATLLTKPQFFLAEGSGTFTFDSHQYNSSDAHYLSADGWVDSNSAAAWTIGEVEDGVYTLSCSAGYLTGAGFQTGIAYESSLTSAGYWQLLTKDDVIASMSEATSYAPVDVTALIAAPELKRNSNTSYYQTWTVTGYDGTGTPSNYAFGSGEATANCAESYHSTNGFNINQEITLPLAGYYTLSAKGFYRDDSSTTLLLPVLYAGTQTATFRELDTSANTMAEAYAEFLNGLHQIDAITIQATQANETITIGFKGEDTSLWNIFGELELLYYGTEEPVLPAHECMAEIGDWSTTGNNGTFVINDWSTEDDASGMTTPFCQNWVYGSTLTAATISHETLTDLEPGHYTVSMDIRIFSEAGNKIGRGTSFNANGVSEDLDDTEHDGHEGTFGTETEVYGTYTLDCIVYDDGQLDISIVIPDGATYNWIAWKNLSVKYSGPITEAAIGYATADKTVVQPGDEVSITFKKVTPEEGSYTLSGSEFTDTGSGITVSYSSTKEGVFTFTVPATVESNTTFTVTIPAGQLYYTDDVKSEAQTLTFTVPFMLSEEQMSGMFLKNLYNNDLMSRGKDYGTRADVDFIGIPLALVMNDQGKYVIRYADADLSAASSNYFYGTDWAWTDGTTSNATTFTIEEVYDTDGTTLLGYHFISDYGYLYRYDATMASATDTDNNCALAVNGVKNDNYSDDNQVIWTFVDIEERDAIKAAWVASQKLALAAEAGLTGITTADEFDAYVATLTETAIVENEISSTSAGDWSGGTFTVNGVESFETATRLNRTFSGLESGIYKITLNGLDRNSDNDYSWQMYADGYTDLSESYIYANDYEINLKAWGSEATLSGTTYTPNNMTEASTMFDAGSYLNTLYTYVGEDGELSIQIALLVTEISGWAQVKNFSLYKLDSTEETIEWEMTSVGWGTLILPFDADVPDGLTLYAGDALTLDSEGTTITAGDASETIAANTPYLVSGDAATYEFTGTPTNTDDSYTVGMLTGTLVDMSLEDGDFTADSGQYVLQNHDDEGLAFYPITSESTGVTLDAYHCYLTSSVSPMALHLPGMATGIKAVEGDVIANDAIYDLSGRRVSKAVKGVYIQNGKKVLVK